MMGQGQFLKKNFVTEVIFSAGAEMNFGGTEGVRKIKS